MARVFQDGERVRYVGTTSPEHYGFEGTVIGLDANEWHHMVRFDKSLGWNPFTNSELYEGNATPLSLERIEE